jgi:4-carboxymuconolactone decarboxylase
MNGAIEMRSLTATAASLLVLAAAPFPANDAAGRDRKSQTIIRSGSQPPANGPAEYFTGNVRVDPLFPANESIPSSAAYVTFEPGARSAWHTHPAGQRLIVTAGVGLTQEWAGPVVEIRAGDVVVCPPGVKHWHGASPASALTHIAVTGTVNGKNVEWLEKVSDEQYASAHNQKPGDKR